MVGQSFFLKPIYPGYKRCDRGVVLQDEGSADTGSRPVVPQWCWEASQGVPWDFEWNLWGGTTNLPRSHRCAKHLAGVSLCSIESSRFLSSSPRRSSHSHTHRPQAGPAPTHSHTWSREEVNEVMFVERRKQKVWRVSTVDHGCETIRAAASGSEQKQRWVRVSVWGATLLLTCPHFTL